MIFRQQGANTRIGNTLIWIVSAYDWCLANGYAFCFPKAPLILGELLDARSPLLGSSLLPDCRPADASSQSIDRGWLQGFLDWLFHSVPLDAPTARGASFLSPLPGYVGLISDTAGLGWCDPQLKSFVDSHRIVVIDEPFRFKKDWQVSEATKELLLPPSASVLAVLDTLGDLYPSLIGVHVRQTDYARWLDGKFFFNDAFYNELIQSLLDGLGDTDSLMVASDGEFEATPEVDCRLAKPDIASDLSGPALDFTLLAGCDDIIGPLSTFSGQAARLGSLWNRHPVRKLRIDPEVSATSNAETILKALREKSA